MIYWFGFIEDLDQRAKGILLMDRFPARDQVTLMHRASPVASLPLRPSQPPSRSVAVPTVSDTPSLAGDRGEGTLVASSPASLSAFVRSGDGAQVSRK